MKSKTTNELHSGLMEQPNLDAYLKENAPHFADKNVAKLLGALYKDKLVSKAELARQAGISEVYLHQVFSGGRKPSRDRLICICIGLQSNLEETQRILKQAGYAQIYPKIRREAIICHGIVHRRDLNQINDMLFANNEKTLF